MGHNIPPPDLKNREMNNYCYERGEAVTDHHGAVVKAGFSSEILAAHGAPRRHFIEHFKLVRIFFKEKITLTTGWTF
jgi:hypothetical protein